MDHYQSIELYWTTLAGSPLFPEPELAPELAPQAGFAPQAAPAAAMEALSGSISAAIQESIKSFKAGSAQRSPCEQLTRNAALVRPSSAAGPAGSTQRLRGAPSDRQNSAFFFRDPSIKVAFLGPSGGAQQQQQQLQQDGLMQAAPAQAEGTGVLPLTGACLSAPVAVSDVANSVA
jgi:hypothetical protein